VEAALLAAAGWLDAIGLRQWASAGPWVYPVANVVHVLGVVLLVGSIGILDLRVLGLWRQLPLAVLSRALLPLGVAGLLVQFASGVVLFAADGNALAQSGAFRLKLILMLVALANAAAFRFVWQPGHGLRNGAIRVSALASLVLWVAVASAGRMIAYL
jgi:hypothetical protein